MGVVNSTRQKQWELQVALSQSGGILADVYKSCHMPKPAGYKMQIEGKSCWSVGNKHKNSYSKPQWLSKRLQESKQPWTTVLSVMVTLSVGKPSLGSTARRLFYPAKMFRWLCSLLWNLQLTWIMSRDKPKNNVGNRWRVKVSSSL